MHTGVIASKGAANGRCISVNKGAKCTVSPVIGRVSWTIAAVFANVVDLLRGDRILSETRSVYEPVSEIAHRAALWNLLCDPK